MSAYVRDVLDPKQREISLCTFVNILTMLQGRVSVCVCTCAPFRMSIVNIVAREILDSRGNPTVEVDLHTEKGLTLHLHLVIQQTLLSRATYSKYRDILPEASRVKCQQPSE